MLDHELTLRLGLFALVFGALAAWETLAPRRPGRLPRSRRWTTNLGAAALNSLLLRLALPTTAIGLAALAQSEGWGFFNRLDVALALSFVLSVALLDLVIYLQHVLFHAVPMLARLHQAHHADPEFDATTGVRFHPFEILLSMMIRLAAIAALGAPPLAVLAFELLLNLTAVFNHGNVGLPERLDRALRWGLVTPDMHRIHHSTLERERNSNYGFCLAVWDRLFGTYTVAPAGGQSGMRIGLESFPDAAISTSFGGMLSIPFRGPAMR